MFWRRRGNTRGGCIIIPIPCGCITSPVVVLSGAALLRITYKSLNSKL
jgi:hypothetical protein